MLALLKVIVMGIVQGLSEFLPISSSAHLVFTSNIIGIFSNTSLPDESNYDIVLSMMLHIGTLVAVFIFFWKDIVNITKSFFSCLYKKNYTDDNFKLGLYIIIGTLITVIVALLFKDSAERLMYSPAIVGLLLFVTGIYLIASEKFSKNLKARVNSINVKTAILMSIAQGLAALPGFSRSGWTIATGLFSKTDRVTCARYSFLLSIPIILSASIVYPLKEINYNELLAYNWIYILIGTIVSAVVGYICIKYFLEFLSKYSLNVFGYYCIIVGLFATIAFSLI